MCGMHLSNWAFNKRYRYVGLQPVSPSDSVDCWQQIVDLLFSDGNSW